MQASGSTSFVTHTSNTAAYTALSALSPELEILREFTNLYDSLQTELNHATDDTNYYLGFVNAEHSRSSDLNHILKQCNDTNKELNTIYVDLYRTNSEKIIQLKNISNLVKLINRSLNGIFESLNAEQPI